MRNKILIRCTVFLVCVLSAVHGGILPEGARDQLFNIYKNVALEVRDAKYDPITEDKVQYFLFTKERPTEYTRIDPYHLDRFSNLTCKLAFLIHGWTNSRDIQWYEDVKNALLNREEEFCVIEVDWAEPAGQLYTVSSISTYDVAKYVAKFIVDLNRNCSLPFDRFLIIGHSLGGQISGFIGKRVQKATGQKLPRIVALDPAGPLFTQRPEDKRLNPNDAEVVHVIHTDGDAFGYKNPVGTIDFFPNGGNSQPGCRRIDLADPKSIISEPISCDHQRAWDYFSEAVLNPDAFIAKQCDDWENFSSKKCGDVEVNMGDLQTNATGNFYLETNKDKPYSKRNRGGTLLTSVSKLVQH